MGMQQTSVHLRGTVSGKYPVIKKGTECVTMCDLVVISDYLGTTSDNGIDYNSTIVVYSNPSLNKNHHFVVMW
jgi:hypothetical protein